DGNELFMRLEGTADLAGREVSIYLTRLEADAAGVPQAPPRHMPPAADWIAAHWEIRLQSDRAELFHPDEQGIGWVSAGSVPRAVMGQGIWEFALPYAGLGCRPGDMLEVRVVVYHGEAPAETGAVRFPLPAPAAGRE
ncbi:MAG: hypothetical protein ACP5TV_08065, partial [Anaerolineae bacterium]